MFKQTSSNGYFGFNLYALLYFIALITNDFVHNANSIPRTTTGVTGLGNKARNIH